MVSRDRPTVLVTAPLRGEGLERLEAIADVILDPWIDHDPVRLYTEEQLAARLEADAADVAIVEADQCGGPVFDLPLRAVGSVRGDPVNVDVAAATARGIPIIHAPARNADGVAELTVALLFGAARHVVAADAEIRRGETYADGKLPYQKFRSWELAGRTVGIVGLGAVGRAAKWRFEGLGMRVIAADPYAEEATHSLDDLIAQADVVSMHAKVTPETTRMIGAEQFAAMRDGAIYLNSARAELHDTDALVDALRVGVPAAAGLDHFEGEYLAPDHPLASMGNVVLTPHIGGATYDTEARQATMMADGLTALLDGTRPPHLLNPEVLA